MLKRLIKIADIEENIPFHLITGLLNEAVNEVRTFFHAGFKAPPKHIRTWYKKREYHESYIENYYSVLDMLDKTDVYEIWQLILEDNTEVYIVLSAEHYNLNLKRAKWENPKYHGFYDTLSAAVNYISKGTE